MMNTKIAMRVEELYNKAEMVSSFRSALFSAIYEGQSSPREYEWAFILFGTTLSELKTELGELTEELFQIVREEKNGKTH